MSGDNQQNELDKWNKRFKLFFYATPLTTLSVFILQLYFTRGSYSTELNLLNNWQTFTATFNLPIGIFTALAAITTLIGMYQRSLQLTIQLKRIEEQFELAQSQFGLSKTKENFMLFVEHKKVIKESVTSEVNILLTATREVKAYRQSYKNGIEINFHRFYKNLFPKNTSESMNDFSLATSDKAKMLDFNSFKVELMEIKKDYYHLSYTKVEKVITLLGKTGFLIKAHCYDEKEALESLGNWAANFFLDLAIIIMVCKPLGLISEENTMILQNLCFDITDSIEATLIKSKGLKT